MTATITIRVDERLAELAKDRARQEGVSLNQLATDLLNAALDPTSAGTLVESLRERLRRAGLQVAEPPKQSGTSAPSKPTAKQVAAAMKAAGQGTPLAKLVASARR